MFELQLVDIQKQTITFLIYSFKNMFLKIIITNNLESKLNCHRIIINKLRRHDNLVASTRKQTYITYCFNNQIEKHIIF
jgi:hypothetical protein